MNAATPGGVFVGTGGHAPTGIGSATSVAGIAAETGNLSRAQILQQAGNAMVAQANAMSQSVLQLLQQR